MRRHATDINMYLYRLADITHMFWILNSILILRTEKP